MICFNELCIILGILFLFGLIQICMIFKILFFWDTDQIIYRIINKIKDFSSLLGRIPNLGIPKNKKILLLANHVHYYDNLVVLKIAGELGLMGYQIKSVSAVGPIEKKSLSSSEIIVVGVDTADIIERKLSALSNYSNYCMIHFPEGKFKKITETEPHRHINIPKLGFLSFAKKLNCFDYILDLTIIYYKNNRRLVFDNSNMYDFLDANTKIEIISELLPFEENKNNILNIFREKETKIEQFMKQNNLSY